MTGRKILDKRAEFVVGQPDILAVINQKGARPDQRRPLVPFKERVIVDNTGKHGDGEDDDIILFAVTPYIPRLRDRAVQPVLV